MNIKNITLSIFAFFLIFNTQSVYTKELQVETNSQSDVISDQNNILSNDSQQDQEIWKFIQETFQKVTSQTESIQFSLQAIEQIINAGKIKLDTQKVSKSQLLLEIKEIKLLIATIADFYTKQLDTDEAIIKGTFFNTAFIDYLLPVMQHDITTISVEQFDKAVSESFEQLITEFQDPSQLSFMIEQNEANIQSLIDASSNIGLTTFNKVYRFLDTKQVPFYGKSTFATALDATKLTAAIALVYTMGIYGLTTSETRVPFLNNQKFPLQDLIGNYTVTERFIKQQDVVSAQKILQDEAGVGNKLDIMIRGFSNPLITPLLAALSYIGKEPAMQCIEYTKKLINNGINYYAKGDMSTPKDSGMIQKTYFKDMIGGEHLEKLARELTDYLKNPTRYERAGISPATGYLLVGPAQTGKSFFAKALKTLIDEEFADNNEKVKFWNVTADDVQYFGGFARIFEVARQHSPIILFIDEIDMHKVRRDLDAKNTQELLTSMNGLETDHSKKVIVIAATNRPAELDFALKQKGRLGNVITFDFPTYECRKQYLEKQLDKKNINLSFDMIDTIAQETDTQTYNAIDDIIRQALQLATFQTRPVTENDFEITLDREIRKIKPDTTISAQEQDLVAIYQAGQAAARHILSTDQQIVKITIDTVDKEIKSKEGFGIINEQKGQQNENHELLIEARLKPTRLGFVFTMSKMNNHELLSDDDLEKELMALLSGHAALELIKGKTFNSFGKEDRAKILDILEKQISQGTPMTHEIREKALRAKDVLYAKAKAHLQKHTSFIKIIADELIKNHTINKKQWDVLVAQYKI